jgi:hypothetical protein
MIDSSGTVPANHLMTQSTARGACAPGRCGGVSLKGLPVTAYGKHPAPDRPSATLPLHVDKQLRLIPPIPLSRYRGELVSGGLALREFRSSIRSSIARSWRAHRGKSGQVCHLIRRGGRQLTASLEQQSSAELGNTVGGNDPAVVW